MSKPLLQRIYELPIAGYLLKSVVFLMTLPRQHNKVAGIGSLAQDVASEQVKLEYELANTKQDFVKKAEKMVITERKLESALESNSDLQYQIHMLQKNRLKQKTVDSNIHSQTLADNHLLDKFYVDFEDTFRGTEEAIYERLKVHLPRIKKLAETRKKALNILDIGCGRAEFLKLMKENGYSAKGLDLNSMMVKRARENGFDIVEDDALSYLLKQKRDTLDIISGFHIVEHIPFDELLAIFSECLRVLRPGGFVLFETPNPENVTVGSWRFYYDPSHLHPLPPDMLAFAIKTCGFTKTEVMRLSPEIEIPSGLNDTESKAHNRLFGPLEYALIAEKWDEKSPTE